MSAELLSLATLVVCIMVQWLIVERIGCLSFVLALVLASSVYMGLQGGGG